MSPLQQMNFPRSPAPPPPPVPSHPCPPACRRHGYRTSVAGTCCGRQHVSEGPHHHRVPLRPLPQIPLRPPARQWKAKERQSKGSGRSRKGSQRAVEGQGKAVKGQWKAKERPRKGSQKGSGKAKGKQWKGSHKGSGTAKGKQWMVKESAVCRFGRLQRCPEQNWPWFVGEKGTVSSLRSHLGEPGPTLGSSNISAQSCHLRHRQETAPKR